MREGFVGTIESERMGRRERFVAVARYAVGILESIANRAGTVEDHPQPLSAEGGETKKNVDPRLVPLLDLSPRELDSPKIEQYCADHAIEFSNQTLYFNLFDGKRAEMFIGPTLETANFFFRNNDKSLLIVFAVVDGGFRCLAFVDGVYDGHYDSDETGKPIYQSLE